MADAAASLLKLTLRNKPSDLSFVFPPIKANPTSDSIYVHARQDVFRQLSYFKKGRIFLPQQTLQTQTNLGLAFAFEGPVESEENLSPVGRQTRSKAGQTTITHTATPTTRLDRCDLEAFADSDDENSSDTYNLRHFAQVCTIVPQYEAGEGY
jgi:hypothetical protein